MISLCMIVKNEAANLDKCLKAVVGCVDEIIIVDTGSSDNTKKIAANYTNKLYDFKWCDDFAKARNFSIEKSNNDWVLVMDADENIFDYNKKKILEFVSDKKNEEVVGRIKRINPFEDVSGVKRYIERVNRLFNKNHFKYTGLIHEQITALNGKNYSTKNIEIAAEHFGYTKEVIEKTNKLERNISMLKKAIAENTNDPYLYYQLGKTYYMGKDYKSSCECFEKALNYKFDYRLEYVEDLIESYGYALINTNRFTDSLTIDNYNKYYSKLPDFNFLMGLIYMNNAQFSKAVESYLKCTQSNEGRIEGITSYLPYYNIGVIYECLGYKNEAIGFYKKCGNYKLAVERIKKYNN